jgi:hypothetical protein
MAQNLVVVLLVVGCFVYTLWTLAPKGPRSRLAIVLLKLPLPLLLQRPLSAAMRQQGGCGCEGCDRSVAAKSSATVAAAGLQTKPEFQPLTFVRGNFSKKTQR